MRRIVFTDEDHEVKVTLDMPEELFLHVKQYVSKETDSRFRSKEFQTKLLDSIKSLASYTMNKHMGEISDDERAVGEGSS